MVYGDGVVLTKEDERSYSEKCTLYVGNLSFDATETIIREHFEHYGSVAQVRIVLNKQTNRPNGVAFVQFTKPEPTVEAMRGLNGTYLLGRPLSMGFQGFKIDRAPRKERHNPYDYFNKKDTEISKIKAQSRGVRYRPKWISDHQRQGNQEEVAPKYRKKRANGRSKDWYSGNREDLLDKQRQKRAERDEKRTKRQNRNRSRSKERDRRKKRTYEIPDN